MPTKLFSIGFSALMIAVAALLPACSNYVKPSDRVVVYSAQDEEFAARVFGDFSTDSALTVAPKYDTEANKSVSLAAELAQEAGRPRCDVHWNNEVIGTIRLAREGVYEPYESPAAAPFPEWTRPGYRTWQAFASRARVIIVNTKLVPDVVDRPRSLLDHLRPPLSINTRAWPLLRGLFLSSRHRSSPLPSGRPTSKICRS